MTILSYKTSQKVQIMLAVIFFRNWINIMLVMTNYANIMLAQSIKAEKWPAYSCGDGISSTYIRDTEFHPVRASALNV